MVSGLLIGALSSMIQTGSVKMTEPEIVSVSLFKNGYTFVTRKIAIVNSNANFVEVPQASLGSLWFWTNAGEIDSITTANDIESKVSEVAHQNFYQILSGNLGRSVTLELKSPNGSTAVLEGKIKTTSTEVVVIEAARGGSAIPFTSIHSVTSSDKDWTWTSKTQTKTEKKFYQLKTKGAVKEVYMMSLERGATWAPAYAVDLSDPEKLILASKATILNDTLDVQKASVRLITGFPNLQFKDILDPFSSNMTVDQWLGSLNGGYSRLPSGPGGRAVDMMMQNAYAPRKEVETNWGGSNAGDAGGEQIGDLFFYDLPSYRLKKGSRTYESLFKFDSKYEHIYTWDIADQVDSNGTYRPVPANQQDSEEVWHTIRFKNSSGKPLTTAAASIFSKGELIGQSMLNYCAASSDCDLRINKSLDVRAETSEEEVERQRGAIKDQYNNPRWDLVTVKGTLEVTNGRKEDIQMTITKQLTGEYVSGTGDPSIVKTTKGLRQMNPSLKVTWKPKAKGKGEKTRFDYTYKLYVPTQ
jgi:hypothetical protein